MRNEINITYYICQNDFCNNEWKDSAQIIQTECIACGSKFIWQFNSIKQIRNHKGNARNGNI